MLPFADIFIYPKPSIIRDIKYLLLVMIISIWMCFYGYESLLFGETLEYERNAKITSSMVIMGLRMYAYWLSWISIEGIVIFILSLILSPAIMFMSLNSNCNLIILFLFILFYVLSMI